MIEAEAVAVNGGPVFTPRQHWHLDRRNTTPDLLAWWCCWHGRVMVVRVDRAAWTYGHRIVVAAHSWPKTVVS